MKKLFIAGALMLSAFAFTSMQAKETTVQAEGMNTEPECRYWAIDYLMGVDLEYGSTDWQSAYLELRNDCLGGF
jgi:hypothetical protein